jgi:hypothetical protein
MPTKFNVEQVKYPLQMKVADDQKQKRKQRPQKRSQPYNTPREAMEGLMTQKNFSSRLNLAAMKELGLDPGDGPGGGFDGLQVMDEKDDDENEKEDDNEKYDERGEYFCYVRGWGADCRWI